MKLQALSAAVLAATCISAASAAQLVTNGGFETGDLTGWTTSGIAGAGPCPIENKDWNVSGSGTATGCTPAADPAGSAFAAYVMNDGTGPLTYTLSQIFGLAGNTMGGSFSFDLTQINTFDAGRTLTVTLDNLDDATSITLYTASTFSADSTWASFGGDISAFLAAAQGDDLTLTFANFIPLTWSGPAGLGIDNVSIDAVVPEPASLALLALGLAGLGFSRRKYALS